ncbi:MAG TPA: septal ring lytic transglycosylase RlpA family protein [Candidatus Binatia bacterium]|nr:septal ring lytic transglycosylase RlpA family protein [Candidatus Binatia bacterium]
MGRWGARLALAAALGVAGCSLFRPAPPPVVGGVQIGVASWYGPGFHGNRTANGEIYDQYEMTAAHPSLPLGTRVMVTNLANGRSVEVRINDRGPFVDGRVIDLSYAAARTVAMIGPGTARVRIDVLGAALAPPPPLVPPPVRDLPATLFLVEVASLSDAGRAEHLASVLKSRLPETFVSPLPGGAGTYYRVRIGPFPLRDAAVARAERVTRLGYPAIIVEEPR